MHVAIRVDSSNIIGTGHIYRALSLAEQLQKRKISVMFICQKFSGNLINLIKKKKFKIKVINNFFLPNELKILKNHFKKWNYRMQINDFKKTKGILNKIKCDWIILDHYGLSETWEREASKHTKIAVIDDLLNKKHFCRLYINYHNALLKKQKAFLSNPECKILDGLKYAIINKKYLVKKKNITTKKNNKIFIFMGGVDSKKIAIKIIKKIKNYFNITILLGINCDYTNEALIISRKNKFIKILKKNYDSLRYFFDNYDLVISSGGLNMYEQICCGANSLIIPQNKYQKKICKNLFNKGYINYLNSPNKINFKTINKLINTKKQKKVIDGLGVDRIVQTLISS